jgi:uncharacterized UPF0160 family protein
MNWLRSKKTVAVHDGNFHPDDVFSVALLSIIYNGKIKIVRTREKGIYSKADFIVDVGLEYDPAKNKFDHHQEGNAGFRDNKISYSSFGLLWKEYGEKVCGSKKIADILDKKLVVIIDADDCGVSLCTEIISDIKPFMLTDAIYALRPTWKENTSCIDDYFVKAVDFAKRILLREIKITQDIAEAEVLMVEIYNNTIDKRIIIFEDKYLPKILLYKYPEPVFIIYKERYGNKWRVTTIEKTENAYEPRKNFPGSWWGKTDKELADISGVEDAIFCRNGGIFAGAKSKEGAIKLAKIALEN